MMSEASVVGITTNITKHEPSVSKKWYTEDEVSNEKIAAYMLGKEDLKKESQKSIDAELNAAKILAENIYFNLRGNKIPCKSVRLKKIARNSFEGIFIIPEKQYYSPESFELSYKIAVTVLNKMSPIKSSFNFMFMPKAKNINIPALLSDGYFWTFSSEKRKGIK